MKVTNRRSHKMLKCHLNAWLWQEILLPRVKRITKRVKCSCNLPIVIETWISLGILLLGVWLVDKCNSPQLQVDLKNLPSFHTHTHTQGPQRLFCCCCNWGSWAPLLPHVQLTFFYISLLVFWLSIILSNVLTWMSAAEHCQTFDFDLCCVNSSSCHVTYTCCQCYSNV